LRLHTEGTGVELSFMNMTETVAGGVVLSRIKAGLNAINIFKRSDLIRTGPTVVSNQLVKGTGATGATVTGGIKGGGGNIPFHYHIHKYNWYKPHLWFKQTPIIKPPK